MKLIILDTETTGLSFIEGDRVIEIGAVEYLDGKPTGKSFYHLLNPERSIPADAVAIHGITDEHVRGKPLFREVAAELIRFCSGAKVVAHNANFDVGMLDNELELAGLAERMSDVTDEIVDSVRIARAIHPKLKNDLDSLMVRYGVDASSRAGGHNARVDCALLGEVFFKMIEGVDLSLMNMSNVKARTAPTPVVRPSVLARVQVSESEMASHEAVLDDMVASGAQPVARRPRMG